MQIVIPMSGIGERFRQAGYLAPKPLIEVEGRPIIAHVLGLFPGEEDVLFICNRDHLDDPALRLRETLLTLRPTARIHAVAPHKQGPIWAVLQASELIDPARPVMVNYCDFTCYWDWADFKDFVAQTKCDGAIPAYRGFHPHSLGSTYYAYVDEQNLWARRVQEKQPYTDTPLNEFASSGGYYFRSGETMLSAFRKTIEADLNVNGEYYVSMAYQPLMEAGGRVAIYELQHFMQWGTPADLEEYLYWSRMFRRFAEPPAPRAHHSGVLVIPMAGLGDRYRREGYETAKPLIEVGGVAMAARAALDMPQTPLVHFVSRRDLPGEDTVRERLRSSVQGAEVIELEGLTEGQAITCLRGLDGLDLSAPASFAPSDSGALYDAAAFEAALAAADVLVWAFRGHKAAARSPASFSWVAADAAGLVTRIALKEPLGDPAHDPIVIGSFTFKRARDFSEATARLVAADKRTRGEFYADAVINEALELGLRVQMFEVDFYIGWGTPDELRTFEYWQSCFHKWPAHPYRLERDARVPEAARAALEARFAAWKPTRPV